MDDFKHLEDKEIAVPQQQQGNANYIPPVRVRLPRGREIIGVITIRFGGNRMEVVKIDGVKK